MTIDRTREEVACVVTTLVENSDVGVAAQAILPYTSHKQAKPYICSSISEDEWNREYRKSLKVQEVVDDLKEYMPHAWYKVSKKRHKCSTEALEHVAVWLWMLGCDTAGDVLEYGKDYGVATLKEVCSMFGWDHSQWDVHRLRVVH
jgi:hypothetical protein